jgi:hypothetical protein
MKTLRKLASVVCTTGILLLASAASATPVLFDITGALFTPGAGYGIDANENNETLLDVRFSNTTFIAQHFSLNGANDFATFTFGTIGLYERNAAQGITANEQNNLTVTAKFTFVSPAGTPPQTLFATGTATTGSVSDVDVDYKIDWAPIFVSFGTGGQFRIDLNDLGFNANGFANGEGDVQTQTATITLIRESIASDGTPIPEPSTVALFGLGLLGAAFTRRKAARGH